LKGRCSHFGSICSALHREHRRSAALYCGTAFAFLQVQTAHAFRFNERDTVMLHSRSVQTYVNVSEDRDLMFFSAWLLACALFLQESYQQPRQP
jgi:hypothetical protein